MANNLTHRPTLPTPLSVSQRGNKTVTLGFNTQEEADLAWRYLSALAEAHANRTHASQIEPPPPKHRYISNSSAHGPDSEHRAWGCECDVCMMRPGAYDGQMRG